MGYSWITIVICHFFSPEENWLSVGVTFTVKVTVTLLTKSVLVYDPY